MDNQTVSLIGYRATGKTTVSVLLAKKLAESDPRWRAVDSDVEIEKAVDKTIAQIFQEEGELSFRDKETWMINCLCRDPQTVIATGGGAIVRPENRDALKRWTTVVWLQAPIETIFQRMFGDKMTETRRPNLTEETDPKEEIKKVLTERTPWYQEIAQIIVDTDGKSPEQITDEIYAALKYTAST